MTETPPRPAATVVLLRPSSARFDVFLVRRHDAIAFMGGAHVFPGGRVDIEDRSADLAALSDGGDAIAARMPDIGPADAVALAIAGVRELFEEAGVLLARDATGSFVHIGVDNQNRMHEYRDGLAERTITLIEIVTRERLRLALHALAPFAHWVTPKVDLKRFDTRFFMSVTPPGQDAAHDERETTQGQWIDPAEAIASARRGEIALPPPTWTTLRLLARHASIDSVLAWARSCHVPRIEPAIAMRGETRVITLPGDPTYPAVEGFDAAETRFVLEGGKWRPVGVEP